MRSLSHGLFLALGLCAASLAAEPYLALEKIDGLALLPPPPPVGSAEQAADHEEAFAIYSHHGDLDWAQARSEVTLTIFSFTPALGPWLQPGKFPKAEAFFRQIEAETKLATNPVKEFWHRRRPYQNDPRITPVAPEESASYPSGHSTRGIVYARLLAEIFPEKRAELMEIGRQIGWRRVLAGNHYPTDIVAGRTLGLAIAREFLASPAMRADFAAVKAELLAGAGR